MYKNVLLNLVGTVKTFHILVTDFLVFNFITAKCHLYSVFIILFVEKIVFEIEEFHNK